MTVFNSFKYNSLTNELIFKSTKQKHPSVANILVLFRIQGEFLHLSSLQLFFFKIKIPRCIIHFQVFY